MNSRIRKIQTAMSEARATGLQEAVYYCYGSAVEGDLVEFGTMTGYTASAIGEAMVAVEAQYGRPKKKLYLFDSFVGLPEPIAAPDVSSPHVKLGHWTAGGCKVLGREELFSIVAETLPTDQFKIVEGWYNESVPAMPSETTFGFIHVDCDLYQSTIDALSPLFQRGQVASGAVLCFDDWTCNRASNAFGEQRAFTELSERFNIRSSAWGYYTWGGARFIVHDYIGCRA
jgi:O-methyltransferase